MVCGAHIWYPACVDQDIKPGGSESISIMVDGRKLGHDEKHWNLDIDSIDHWPSTSIIDGQRQPRKVQSVDIYQEKCSLLMSTKNSAAVDVDATFHDQLYCRLHFSSRQEAGQQEKCKCGKNLFGGSLLTSILKFQMKIWSTIYCHVSIYCLQMTVCPVRKSVKFCSNLRVIS